MRIALALAALLMPGTAGAQWDQAISDKDLLDPWIQAAAVLRVLSVDDSTAAAGGTVIPVVPVPDVEKFAECIKKSQEKCS